MRRAVRWLSRPGFDAADRAMLSAVGVLCLILAGIAIANVAGRELGVPF